MELFSKPQDKQTLKNSDRMSRKESGIQISLLLGKACCLKEDARGLVTTP